MTTPDGTTGAEGAAPRPRLLVLATSAELYGSDRALLAALPELVEAFRVVIAFPADGPAVGAAEALGAGTCVLPDFAFRTRVLQPSGLLPWLHRWGAAARRLGRLHRQEPFDLLYANTINNGLGPLLRTLWRRPLLLHVHECPDQRRGFLRAVLLLARRTSDHVVLNSAFTQGRIRTYDRRLADRGVVVHIGVDLPPPLTPAAGNGTFRISCPARIHPKKGHQVLVEATRIAAADGRHWELHLYGDALPEHEDLHRDLLRQIEAGGLDGAFRWHGFVADATIAYREADVCVVPSIVPEEYSLVCLEASANAVPVVATGPGGPSEILVEGTTGLVVPPGDAAALSAALAELEDDPGRRRSMGAAGRERVAAHFTRAGYGNALRLECEAALGVGTGGRRLAPRG